LNFCGTFDASRVIAIHNPVNLGRFDPGLLSKQDARTKLGLDLTVPVLGVLAQLAPWKGQDDAIHSVALLRKRFPGLQLLLVGEVKFPSKASRYDNRRYAQSLNQLVDNLEVTRNVHFLGEREDVPSILRALDLLLVPSWEEPFGRSVIEGMAMETPVVATQIGGTTEIISHGIDGLLLPPRMPALWADVIAELLADPERRLQLGSTGRKRVVEAFRVELHVRAVLRAYDRVLGGLEN
jgi:glycosyltransferase involved in cell wall biosynthesis